jgi:hypothetical protein
MIGRAKRSVQRGGAPRRGIARGAAGGETGEGEWMDERKAIALADRLAGWLGGNQRAPVGNRWRGRWEAF